MQPSTETFERCTLNGPTMGSRWSAVFFWRNPARAAALQMALTRRAVATSGDYRHFADLGGTRVSHTINPLHATPLQNRIASVTVLARTCMEADAWATALMVLGEQAGPVIARARRLDALFVLRTDHCLTEVAVGLAFEPQSRARERMLAKWHL